MKNVSQKTVEDFTGSCREAADNGLLRCSSGNMSMRLDGNRMLVTASRSWMGRLTPDDVSLCLVSDGSVLEGRKPSVETGFHAGILRARPEMNVVLHFQSPCATVLACMEPEDINYFMIPEIPFYIGSIAHVPYLAPGSRELSTAVVDAMKEHDLAVMRNHGQVTVASDPDHAIQNAAFFELACEIILRSGGKSVSIPHEETEALLSQRQAAKGV